MKYGSRQAMPKVSKTVDVEQKGDGERGESKNFL